MGASTQAVNVLMMGEGGRFYERILEESEGG